MFIPYDCRNQHNCQMDAERYHNPSDVSRVLFDEPLLNAYFSWQPICDPTLIKNNECTTTTIDLNAEFPSEVSAALT